MRQASGWAPRSCRPGLQGHPLEGMSVGLGATAFWVSYETRRASKTCGLRGGVRSGQSARPRLSSRDRAPRTRDSSSHSPEAGNLELGCVSAGPRFPQKLRANPRGRLSPFPCASVCESPRPWSYQDPNSASGACPPLRDPHLALIPSAETPLPHEATLTGSVDMNVGGHY